MFNFIERKQFLLFGICAVIGLLSGFLYVGLNGAVVAAQSAVDKTVVVSPNIVLPSSALTRNINNPIVPMGLSGSIDDEKTGPRAILKESPTSYKMWYEAVPAPNASTVGYATSTDGKTWTKQGSVLSPSASWEGGVAGEISPNTVLVEGGIYKMWYHSFGPDGKRRIGYATSPNGINWTKNPNPVLDVGADGAFDDYMVTEPRVFNLGNGQYRMYYGAMRQSQQGFAVYRLMTATSANGVNWVKQNTVLFGPVDSGFGIVKDGSQWHLWYGVFDRLEYASSTDGLNWTPGTNNPVLSLNPDPAAPDSQAVGDSVSAYKDGNEFRVMYTGGRYNSFGRNESICLATIAVAGCSYTINSTSQNFSAVGGNGTTSLTTSNGCSWTAATNNSWITINSGAGNGNGSVTFTVQPNTGVARTGTISVGGQVLTINQAAGTAVRRASFDFDGDNKTDISIFRPSSGEWWLNRSSTNQTIAARFGNAADKITPADFTGDGKTDIALWRPATNEWFILRSEDNSFFSFPFGTNGDIPLSGDFDGDGKADASVFRPGSATWYILRSGGGVTIQQFGVNGDFPVVGDYDGDGKSDIAIYRPSNGQWWLSRSSTGVIATTFGNVADKPVPGDFTGDGKTDIAFWRPSTGHWFILRSDDSSYFSLPFGVNGDIPVAGDYDGDGKFDVAVFRPTSATWFIQRTTAGITINQFGLIGDNPVSSAFVP
jgi:hypothetical protein